MHDNNPHYLYDIKCPPETDTDPDDKGYFLPYGNLINRRRRMTREMTRSGQDTVTFSAAWGAACVTDSSSPALDSPDHSPIRSRQSKSPQRVPNKLTRYRSPPPKPRNNITSSIAIPKAKASTPANDDNSISTPELKLSSKGNRTKPYLRKSEPDVMSSEPVNMAKRLLPPMRNRSSSLEIASLQSSKQRRYAPSPPANQCRSLSPVSVLDVNLSRTRAESPLSAKEVPLVLPGANELIPILKKATGFPHINRSHCKTVLSSENHVKFSDKPLFIEYDRGSSPEELMFPMESVFVEADCDHDSSNLKNWFSKLDRKCQRSNSLPPIKVNDKENTSPLPEKEERNNSASSEDKSRNAVSSCNSSQSDNGIFCEVVHSYTPRPRSKPRLVKHLAWTQPAEDPAITGEAATSFSTSQ